MVEPSRGLPTTRHDAGEMAAPELDGPQRAPSPDEWAIPECEWKPGGWLSVDSIADHRGGDAWTLRLTAVAFSWNPRSLG